MTYPLRTYASYNTGMIQDFDTSIIANILRMKYAYLIVSSVSGMVKVFKVQNQPTEQDLIASLDTYEPIIGITVGFFYSSHNTIEESEKIELAVIHPNSIEILYPKKAQTGSVELLQIYKEQIPNIVSFLVVNKANIGLDENNNKRYYITSYLLVKTLKSYLIIMQKRIVQKITLGFRYSMPAPMSYSPLSDLLVVATFEYSVIGVKFSDLLDPQHAVDESDLKIVFEYTVSDRIQQLLCGRFFRADSSKTGEICIALTRQLVFIDTTGKLLKELRLDAPLLKAAPVYSRESRYSEILSLLCLQRYQVLLIASGVVKFRNSLQGQASEGEEPVALPGALTGYVTTFPINIITNYTISQYFHSSYHKAADLAQPGLFALAMTSGVVKIAFLGTSQADFAYFKPANIPSAQESKALKARLVQELKGVKLQNDACNQELTARVTQVDVSYAGVALRLCLRFSSTCEVADVVCAAATLAPCTVSFQQNYDSSGAEDQQFVYLPQMTSESIELECVLRLRAGKFFAVQSVHFTMSSYYNGQNLAVSVAVPIPLLAANIIGSLEQKKLKYCAEVELMTPFSSLYQLLGRNNIKFEGDCLALKNLSGDVCLVYYQSNSSICVTSEKVEQLYAGIDLFAENEQFKLKMDHGSVAYAISELLALDNSTADLENHLGSALTEFQAVNQQTLKHLNDSFVVIRENPGSKLDLLSDYIQDICRLIQEKEHGSWEAVERLRGVGYLLTLIKGGNIQKSREYCQFASLKGFKENFGDLKEWGIYTSGAAV